MSSPKFETGIFERMWPPLEFAQTCHGLHPKEECPVSFVPYVINALNAFAVELEGSIIAKIIINKLHAIRPPHIRVEKFKQSAGRELICAN